jgi:hypothetical protein
MKKLLASALLAMGLILNVGAIPPGPPFGIQPPGPPFGIQTPGPPTFSVPDGGSTVLLLGLGLAALAAVRRKIIQD